jgi:hypothetical protein
VSWRRIGGAAAGLQDVAAGLGGERMVGHDHVRLGGHDLVAEHVARCGFRRGRIAREAGADDDLRTAGGGRQATVVDDRRRGFVVVAGTASTAGQQQ